MGFNPIELLQLGFDGIISAPGVFLSLIVGGVIYGMIFGALPGLSSPIALLTLIPVAFVLPITQSLVLMVAVYCGATFGGAFSSILLNIPGTPESVATGFDGYPMTRKGLAGKALGAAITCSSVGGLMGALVFIFVAPYLANLALKFGDADYFGIIVMGLFVVGAISTRSLVKGLLSVALGLLVSTIGMAPQISVMRFTFGSNLLEAGVEFIPVMIGVFALGEILFQFSSMLQIGTISSIGRYTGSKFTLAELWKEKFNVLRSSILGTVSGFIPGIGATLASFLAYAVTKTVSKTPEDLGTGRLEGIVSPETANNAATGGAMIPLFALGIPGGAATAVMLAVFLVQGLQPGPTIFFTQFHMVGTIMVALIIANALVIPLGKLATPWIAMVLKANLGYVVALVVVFCVVGGYTIRNLMVDPYTILLFGIISYYWKTHGFPLAPFILGIVLGPMAEARLVHAMIQHGNIGGVLTSPIGLGFMLFGLLFMVIPLIRMLRSRSKGTQPEGQHSLNLASPLVYSILIGSSAYLFCVTTTWPTPESYLGPAFWPQLSLAGTIVLSVTMIARWFICYLRIKKHKDVTSGVDASLGRFFFPHGWYTVLPMVVVGCYVGLVNVVGFLVLTIIFPIVVLYLVRIRKPLRIVVFSIGLTAFISLIFVGMMKLYLPPGIVFFADSHHWAYKMLFRLF